jgi:methanogenic corrinoid protein MtbC1
MIGEADGLRSGLHGLILDADRKAAADLLGLAISQYGFPAVLSEILDPVLLQVGEQFQRGKLSLAQGYVAGKITEDLLERLNSSTDGLNAISSSCGTAVIGNAEDDYHALGRRMLGTFLRINGWDVVDLGNDVLAVAFVDAAVESGARVIGVSALMLTNAMNIAKVRREIDSRGLRGSIKLAVGGAAFVLRPELVSEVGGDGTASTAMEAPLLFKRLCMETREVS